MKFRIIFTTLLLLLLKNTNGQSDSIYQKYRHELGADMTGLLKQFFNWNQNQVNTPYSPTYYISYRYHLHKSNIRFGIGGNYSNKTTSPFTINGAETTAMSTDATLSFRLGYEKVSELSTRWQAYYGLDIRPSFSNTKNPYWYSNAGYINGSVSSSQVYGLAPLLGFRFKISKRVSILTEASVSFIVEKTASQRTYRSQDLGIYPAIPYDKKMTATNLSANFNQPVFIILTVDL